jgi:hypothetical protein
MNLGVKDHMLIDDYNKHWMNYEPMGVKCATYFFGFFFGGEFPLVHKSKQLI